MRQAIHAHARPMRDPNLDKFINPAPKNYCYCLISYRAGAWHYQIFPDFLNSGFKMASKTEGKAEVIACSWNDIKGQITPES